ncbi:MAG TPA: saccharopine dehydrogenase NADP-binding domain-containing protein [Candidatus Hydrogenedentes bacterium]|nr:saccharopine dehydrogenase NADP-binding domain-containing protein [Candidatus Hydrogenedentota bacterium]HPG69616.1 saccharopine dehydrogenase NADP-binding domain-containing protein [Candidatus Hydrogenedentota bacterium]
MAQGAILVLGAYGLAGRAIVQGLVDRTPHHIVAAGRNPDRLQAFVAGFTNERVESRVLDVADHDPLRDACAASALVINAVGPYAQHGAATARVVVESGRAYLDCANEQIQYERLRALDGLARERGVPMITAAGAVPGMSTLLTAHVLERFPQADSVDWYWAQFRHAYEASGLGSFMSGVLEAVHRPVALVDGAITPIILGESQCRVDFGPPFGERLVFELPTIDTLTLPARFSLRHMHSWFYMGDLPTWQFKVIRILQPHRRPWAYRLIERVTRRVNAGEMAKALAAGWGPEALLVVNVRTGAKTRTGRILFRDGAVATACLPVLIAREYLAGRLNRPGLASPLDLVDPAVALGALGDAALQVNLPDDASADA